MDLRDLDLRLGDSFAGLADLETGSVDVTITDPPFDARTHRAAAEVGDWRTDKRRRAALPFPPLTPERLAEMAGHLARVTRRWIVIFAAERQVEPWAVALESAGARFVRLGAVVRTNPCPQRTGDRPGPAIDPLVIAHAGMSGSMRWNGGGRAAKWETPGARYDEGGQIHPAQKELALIRQLVEAFSNPGELVLDPFAGAGTTAAACKSVGRRFLGWEISSDYHAAAVRRLDATREQLPLGLVG